MAIKKAAKTAKAKKTVKKAKVSKVVKTKKAAAKKTVKKAAPAKKANKKGSKYVCGKCGLVVSVDKACGCVKTCDLVCCGKQMKAKK